MKHAVIGKFFTETKDAVAYQQKMETMWKRRVRFCVLKIPQGNLVISESAMRKCYPHLFERKVAKINKKNYTGRLTTK